MNETPPIYAPDKPASPTAQAPLPPSTSCLNRRQRRAAASRARRTKPRGPVATNVNPLVTHRSLPNDEIA